MKIDVRQVPETGLMLSEEFSSKGLDLDTDLIKFLSPLKVKALVSKSYGALKVSITISSLISISCGRCLKEIKKDFERKIELNYAVDKSDSILDLDEDIREEIILDYPIKPLCRVDCKGLCLKCGANLNEGGCNCGTT
jgi:uncharacterized protein